MCFISSTPLVVFSEMSTIARSTGFFSRKAIGRGRAVGLARHDEVAFLVEEHAHALPGDGVVIDEQDAALLRRLRRLGWRGRILFRCGRFHAVRRKVVK
jgi:hypothetical protein